MAVGVGIASSLVEAPAVADDAGNRHYDLENTSWPFLTAETGGAALSFLFVVAANGPAATCRWCETNGFDDAVRNALRASNPRVAGYVSHGFSLGAVPVVAAGGALLPALGDHRLDRAGEDVWILANAFILTTGISDGVKRAVGRQRPAFHYGVQGDTEAASHPDEENLSFFSVDTSEAFAVAACGATLAYLHDYEIAPWVLGGGAALATTSGVLRISADMHWASDVITGALVGTAVGVSVPLLLHRRRTAAEERAAVSLTVVPLPRGISMLGEF